MSQPAKVVLKKTAPKSVLEDVRAAMEEADWKQFITRGGAVALKINLGWDKLIPGAISAPWVVEGVVRTVKEYAGAVYLVEADQVVLNVERTFRLTGMDRICREYHVEWVNMSKGQFVSLPDNNRLVIKDIHVPEILRRTELITIPVMKTHNKTTISGAVKNQWGCLPKLRHNFHLVLSEALVDVNRIFRPRFAVMDGTVALEGNGPKSGQPKEMGVLLASGDSVALDSVAAQVMGFDPLKIEHLQLCAQYGMGTADPDRICVVGERPKDVARPFKPARHNVVSWFELVLRRSLLRRLAFDSPLFPVFCWMTRRYYDLWDLSVGRRLRAKIMRESPYGAQWQQE